ncbi:MAG: hypothetical protein OZSIB_0544 [Candidatus Ozemobacter sibiricus]|uniref:Prepilin-type N-terminal cleavage/methylation domain-containing protein n=1 Tax=Candidatus Ozemobacter sibiricus TaxID=2268124 RepID=A0A367ZLM4_9BACT|nr:MAG: hypothetical protein OZSIB_0544 [Candidatus Ozemobacter sibiricus]
MMWRRSESCRERGGLTLVEMTIAVFVFSLVLGAGFRAMTIFMGRTSQRLSERLVLQMEARKALLALYQRLQQSIEVLAPPPGTTLPYIVYKDLMSNICCLYLEPDPARTKEEGQPIYRAMLLVRDPASAVASAPIPVMQQVARLQFTAHSPTGVLISATLRGGKGEFSLVNFVRLKNAESDE